MSDDLIEARTLLLEAEMHRTRGPSPRKDKAAKALFEQLQQLDGQHGLRLLVPDGEWYEVVVQVGKRRALVCYYSEQGVRLSVDDREVNIPLDFDSARQVFVGQHSDTFHTPTPGEPVLRRPAIAVLVEALLSVLSPSGDDER